MVLALLLLSAVSQWRRADEEVDIRSTAEANALIQADGWATEVAVRSTVEADALDAELMAEAQRQIAVARQLAAQAELVRDRRAGSLVLSVLLAAESLRRSPSPEGGQIMRHGLLKSD